MCYFLAKLVKTSHCANSCFYNLLFVILVCCRFTKLDYKHIFTRLFVLLTFWPPFPLPRTNFSSRSFLCTPRRCIMSCSFCNFSGETGIGIGNCFSGVYNTDSATTSEYGVCSANAESLSQKQSVFLSHTQMGH